MAKRSSQHQAKIAWGNAKAFRTGRKKDGSPALVSQGQQRFGRKLSKLSKIRNRHTRPSTAK